MEYLTIEEIAKLLGKTRRTIEMQIKRGIYDIKQVPGRGSRGRKTLIALSSLPSEVIKKYFEKRDRAEQTSQFDGQPKDMGWLLRLSPKQQGVLMFRARVVKEAKLIRDNGGKDRTKKIKDLGVRFGVNVATIYRWAKESNWLEDLSGLAPKARSDQGRPRAIHPEVWEFALASYADSNRRPSVMQVFRGVVAFCETKGITPPSYFTLSRHLKAWERNNPQRSCALRQGLKSWENKFGMYVPREIESLGVNQIWMVDHTVLDIFCINPSTGKPDRPWITACLDLRSRVIMGYCLSFQPSSQTIALAFRNAFTGKKYHGVPKVLYVDNGKDFRCRRFNGSVQRFGRVDVGREMLTVLQVLNIEKIHALPYNPKAKAQIERWFGTIESEFMNLVPGFSGHNVAAKPEKLKEEVKSGELMSFEEIKAFMARAIDAYHHRVHKTLGKAPLEVFYELWTKQTKFFDERVIDLLLMKREEVSITRNGVRVNGQRYFRYDEEFLAAIGKKATVGYDPDDPSFVVVWVDGKCLGRVPIAESVAFGDGEKLKQMIEIKKRQRKVMVRFQKEMEAVRERENTLVLMLEGALRRDVRIEPREPEDVEYWFTGLEKDVKEIRRIEKQKQKRENLNEMNFYEKWLGVKTG